jgi:hypothetical protein
MFLLRRKSVVSHNLPETWLCAIVGTDPEFCGLRLEVWGIGSTPFWDIFSRIHPVQ